MSEPTDPPAEPTTSEPAQTPEPAQSLTLGQRLSAAANALNARGTSAELVAARAQIETLTAERDAARGLHEASHAACGVAMAERDQARASLATAEAAVTDFEARVRARSVEDCASVGVPVAGLPVAGGIGEGGAPTTTEELNKALEGKSFQEKRAILKAWRERDKPAQN